MPAVNLLDVVDPDPEFEFEGAGEHELDADGQVSAGRVADQRLQKPQFSAAAAVCLEIRTSLVADVFADQRASRIASALPAGHS